MKLHSFLLIRTLIFQAETERFKRVCMSNVFKKVVEILWEMSALCIERLFPARVSIAPTERGVAQGQNLDHVLKYMSGSPLTTHLSLFPFNSHSIKSPVQSAFHTITHCTTILLLSAILTIFICLTRCGCFT